MGRGRLRDRGDVERRGVDLLQHRAGVLDAELAVRAREGGVKLADHAQKLAEIPHFAAEMVLSLPGGEDPELLAAGGEHGAKRFRTGRIDPDDETAAQPAAEFGREVDQFRRRQGSRENQRFGGKVEGIAEMPQFLERGGPAREFRQIVDQDRRGVPEPVMERGGIPALPGLVAALSEIAGAKEHNAVRRIAFFQQMGRGLEQPALADAGRPVEK